METLLSCQTWITGDDLPLLSSFTWRVPRLFSLYVLSSNSKEHIQGEKEVFSAFFSALSIRDFIQTHTDSHSLTYLTTEKKETRSRSWRQDTEKDSSEWENEVSSTWVPFFRMWCCKMWGRVRTEHSVSNSFLDIQSWCSLWYLLLESTPILNARKVFFVQYSLP